MSEGPTQENINAYLRDQVLPAIEEHGYTVQGVFAVEETQTSFVYTVGLTTRGWPELIMLGNVQEGGVLLQQVVHALDHQHITPVDGLSVDFFDTGYELRFRTCPTRSEQFSFTTAHAIYPDVTGLQVVLPDDEHRYPNDPGHALTWQKLI